MLSRELGIDQSVFYLMKKELSSSNPIYLAIRDTLQEVKVRVIFWIEDLVCTSIYEVIRQVGCLYSRELTATG